MDNLIIPRFLLLDPWENEHTSSSSSSSSSLLQLSKLPQEAFGYPHKPTSTLATASTSATDSTVPSTTLNSLQEDEQKVVLLSKSDQPIKSDTSFSKNRTDTDGMGESHVKVKDGENLHNNEKGEGGEGVGGEEGEDVLRIEIPASPFFHRFDRPPHPHAHRQLLRQLSKGGFDMSRSLTSLGSPMNDINTPLDTAFSFNNNSGKLYDEEIVEEEDEQEEQEERDGNDERGGDGALLVQRNNHHNDDEDDVNVAVTIRIAAEASNNVNNTTTNNNHTATATTINVTTSHTNLIEPTVSLHNERSPILFRNQCSLLSVLDYNPPWRASTRHSRIEVPPSSTTFFSSFSSSFSSSSSSSSTTDALLPLGDAEAEAEDKDNADSLEIPGIDPPLLYPTYHNIAVPISHLHTFSVFIYSYIYLSLFHSSPRARSFLITLFLIL